MSSRREKLPDIMGEALGRLKITEAPRPYKAFNLDRTGDREPDQLANGLKKLRLWGMARVLQEQTAQEDGMTRDFGDLLGLMLQEELTERGKRQILTRLRQAGLRYQPGLDEVDFTLPRGLDRAYFLWLAKGEWLETGDNLIISGPVGVGKTFLSCALAGRFCLKGRTALYRRAIDLWAEFASARENRTYDRLRRKLAKVDLLVLDDWGLTGLDDRQKQDLMAVMDDRYNHSSTLVVSPLPPRDWPEKESGSAMDLSIMDRLLHQAHFLDLKGESVRKLYARRTDPGLQRS